MMRRGFTVVELIITITIMGILLALAVVNLGASQVNGRDTERKEDIAAIATNLEAYYKTGTSSSTLYGRYPSTAITLSGETSLRESLRDIDFKSLTAPAATSVTTSFLPATNALQTPSDIIPQPTNAQYVYQPLQANGALCTTELQECRKFNLFYRLESDNLIYMQTSKNQ